MNNNIKLTAAATSALPRIVIFVLTLIYAFTGLFGHDPWKNDDAISFGVMWELSHGNLKDWVLPHLTGRNELIGTPLPYWLGASSIWLFGSLIGDVNAARLVSGLCFSLSALAIWYATYLLGRRRDVQPMAFAFGGQPSSKQFGRTIADAALLIFLACVGLAQRVHEISPFLLELWGLCLLIYGIVRGLDKPWQGGFIAGFGLVIICLSGILWTGFILSVATLLYFIACPKTMTWRWLMASGIVLLLGLCIWPLLWILGNLNQNEINQAIFIWLGKNQLQNSTSINSLAFMAQNFWAYAWPVWPLSFWSIYLWGKNGRSGWNAHHLVIPGFLFLAQLGTFFFMQELSERNLLVLIPTMAILASFGLPLLKRGLISFIDWLSLLSFTILAGFIWIIWLAKITGIPQATAENVARFIPGYVAIFNLQDLIIAIVITGLWFWVVKWRVSRSQKVIWRCLVISASGTTLMWVLLMTLWLPTIDFAKTYRPVAQRLMLALPRDVQCINSTYLGDAQLASFVYFTKLPLQDNPLCNYQLTHSTAEAKAAAKINRQQLTLIWEDRRASDRDERLRLYRVKPQ